MKTYIFNIIIYMLISFFLCIISIYIESDYLYCFLKLNLLNILITILAVNTATLGLLSTKIQDVYLNFKGVDFTETTSEMKKSLLEQIIIIALSVVVLILIQSKAIIFDLKDLIGYTVLTSVLIFDIHILWDTGNSIFVLLDEIKGLNDNENL